MDPCIYILQAKTEIAVNWFQTANMYLGPVCWTHTCSGSHLSGSRRVSGPACWTQIHFQALTYPDPVGFPGHLRPWNPISRIMWDTRAWYVAMLIDSVVSINIHVILFLWGWKHWACNDQWMFLHLQPIRQKLLWSSIHEYLCNFITCVKITDVKCWKLENIIVVMMITINKKLLRTDLCYGWGGTELKINIRKRNCEKEISIIRVGESPPPYF